MGTLRVIIGGLARGARARFSEFTVGLALATVAVSSGFISYTHICALAGAEGQSWKTAHLMPLCVDGQIVIGSAYFMDGRNRWQKAGGLAFGVLPGIGESLIANWQSGIVHGLFAAAVATVPAQAFACSAFLFERWLHARRSDRARACTDAELLAEALADIAGLREALDAGQALADAALAAVGVTAAALAPRPEPAAPPSLPAAVPWPPSFGPSLPLPVPSPQPARAQRPTLVKTAAPLPRRPLPEDEGELAALVRSVKRSELQRDYQVSKYQAVELRRKYLTDEGGQKVA
jgi:Protein of unknown function (DUF2637)